MRAFSALVLADGVAALVGQTNIGTPSTLERLISSHYPAQYIVQELTDSEHIKIDGHLDEAAWEAVPWLDNFLDLAGPRYANKGTATWQQASREYAKRFTGQDNPTKVKVRWDEHFLYIGAVLHSKHVAASVAGHCDNLTSDVWKGTAVLPYFDDDFEVFIDASQDNYFYIEYEMNANNATYETLWSLPQAGLGSVAPECGGGDSARRVCCNTTWNHGHGLCDRGVETEAGSWTMEMYDPAKRPGTGMQSATTNQTDSWTVEIRLPIFSSSEHGGVINLLPGSHYPGTDPRLLHPSQGQRFWWATFANALHAPWWSTLTTKDTKQPELIKSLCQEVIDSDTKRNGFTQFLVDANNAAPTCYYEAASQNLGGHQYMHNPDVFGYLQFAQHDRKLCRNVQWLARFVLAQIYQAEVEYLMNDRLGNGSYTTSLANLLSPSVCRITNACNSSALALALEHVDLHIEAQEGKKTGPCARYAIGSFQPSNWTGGPCLNVTVSYTVQNKNNPSQARQVSGAINEVRFMHFSENIGQRWDEADSEWLCLDDVLFLKDVAYV